MLKLWKYLAGWRGNLIFSREMIIIPLLFKWARIELSLFVCTNCRFFSLFQLKYVASHRFSFKYNGGEKIVFVDYFGVHIWNYRMPTFECFLKWDIQLLETRGQKNLAALLLFGSKLNCLMDVVSFVFI